MVKCFYSCVFLVRRLAWVGRCVCVSLFGMSLVISYAFAQSPQCYQFRTELAALERQGPGQAVNLAERQRSELARLVGYYRSLGCVRGPLAFFQAPPPPQCMSISQRIQRMETNLNRLQAQASGTAGRYEAQRRRLYAAVAEHCGARPNQQQDNRTFLDRFFNTSRVPPTQKEKAPRRLGGNRIVCVRTCDGFYFPLYNIPGGQANANAMCQALCPGTSTAAYRMSNEDGAISRAVSFSGQRYSALPNAMRYSERLVPDCSCKGNNETWAQVLGPAEKMLRSRPGDILVTEERSDQMAQPQLTNAQRAQQKKEELRLAQEEREAASVSTSVATASGESSGIGGHNIENATIVKRVEGPRALVTDSKGVQKTIRIIAPKIIPPPPNTLQ